MTSFTEYNQETGLISRIVVTDEAFTPKEGFSFIEGAYSDDKFVVIDQAPIPLEVQEKGIDEWVLFRVERNNRLSSSDWTQVSDAPVDQAAWAVYRQELRDLPANTEDPNEVVWPKPPTS
jgi:hypothetical protein